MSEIQRYDADCVEGSFGGQSWPEMEEYKYGDYVKYSDHQSRVKELEAERERAYKDAGDLCLSLYKKHFYEEGNDFGLCDSIVGIISQLDNMSCSMVSQARVKELETAIKTADPIELGRIKNELEKGEG